MKKTKKIAKGKGKVKVAKGKGKVANLKERETTSSRSRKWIADVDARFVFTVPSAYRNARDVEDYLKSAIVFLQKQFPGEKIVFRKIAPLEE